MSLPGWLKGSRRFLISATHFYRRGWKLLLPLAVGVAALVTTLMFLLPTQYSRNVVLEATPVLTDFQKRLGQNELKLTQEKINGTTVLIARTNDYGPVSVDPTYDETTGRVNATLISENRQALGEAGREVAASVDMRYQELYEESLGVALENQISSLEQALENNRDYLNQIEQQSKLFPPDDNSIEKLREDALIGKTKIEAQMEYFERVSRDLTRLADEPVSVKVVAESKVQRVQPFPYTIPLTAMLGCLVAVASVLRFKPKLS